MPGSGELTYWSYRRTWSYYKTCWFDNLMHIPFIDLLCKIKKIFIKERIGFRSDRTLYGLNIRFSNVIHYLTEICINLEDLLATAIDLNAILDICADMLKNRELDSPYFMNNPDIREVAPKWRHFQSFEGIQKS